MAKRDAATIMRAKKARGVEPSKAIRVVFEAFGLDQQDRDHWDILLAVLASVRPKKKRGRPQKWGEAEVVEFKSLVVRARKIWDNAVVASVDSMEEVQSKNYQLPQELASLRRHLEKLIKVDAAIATAMPPDLSDLLFGSALHLLTRKQHLPPESRPQAGKRHRPDVADAIAVAQILQYTGHYRHMSEASLAKYVLSGPARTRGGK
jgi:hypothetical protein